MARYCGDESFEAIIYTATDNQTSSYTGKRTKLKTKKPINLPELFIGEYATHKPQEDYRHCQLPPYPMKLHEAEIFDI